MATTHPETSVPPHERNAPAWLPWLAWTWVGILGLCVLATWLDDERLRLALDFTRHLR
jgi:hypothetical protein